MMVMVSETFVKIFILKKYQLSLSNWLDNTEEKNKEKTNCFFKNIKSKKFREQTGAELYLVYSV